MHVFFSHYNEVYGNQGVVGRGGVDGKQQKQWVLLASQEMENTLHAQWLLVWFNMDAQVLPPKYIMTTFTYEKNEFR